MTIYIEFFDGEVGDRAWFLSNPCVWVCDGDKSGDAALWLFLVSAEGCGKRASRYVLSLGPVVGVILGRSRSAVGSIASRLAMGWDETGPVLVNLVCQGLIWPQHP